MRILQIRVLALISVFLLASLPTSVSASTLQLVVAEDKTTGYQRSAFKHWIDADKNGCNTRAEVLIAEAIVKPKIGPKCKLTGGKWVSAYDGKTIINASLLDVDHMVPLAEAWRSGAWKWTAAERQAFANDLENSEALIAVTLSTNRSKGDKDPSLWMPSIDQCTYTQNWVSVKIKYSLTVDAQESDIINNLLATTCGSLTTTRNRKMPVSTPTPQSTPMTILQPVDVTDNVCPRVVKINLDKQSLLANETTILRIAYEDDKNSFDTLRSGYSNWTKPINLGTLEGGSPILKNFKITKSEKNNGKVIEEIEAQLTAPSAPGVWKFGFLSIHDRGGNNISFEAGNQLCSRRGYVSAPEYNLDLNIS